MSDKNEIAIAIKNVHKEFILPQSKNSTLKQAAVNIVRKNKKVTQKVLDGISFEVNKGDFFGIVGRNGSGKSTLLKLIAGVYTPTAGTIEINGGITPFIELGVGFNPELSGRDNVYLNGALLGFNRKQMDMIYDEIVAFAELEPFMDQKLKNYSSGMQVRLAFSIAIKAKNQTLIFDEVLAVGDEAFQRKCLDVFEKYKAERQTVILVTHSMDIVRRFCNRAMLINEGKIIKIGNPIEVADNYTKLNQSEIERNAQIHNSSTQNSNTILSTALNCFGKDHTNLPSGSNIELDVVCSMANIPSKMLVNLYKRTGEYLLGIPAPIQVLNKNGKIKLSMSPQLGVGNYFFTIESYDEKGGLIGDIYHTPGFTISSAVIPGMGKWAGLVAINHTWK